MANKVIDWSLRIALVAALALICLFVELIFVAV
jgi:hypothetical protein